MNKTSHDFFDLNEHFLNHQNQFFFNSKKYIDLKSDIEKNIQTIRKTRDQYIAVQSKDPYLFIVDFISVILIKKIPVLISKIENDYQIEQLKKVVPFNPLIKSTDNIENHDFTYSIDKSNSHIIFFTSGSTGFPKAIVHSFETLFISASHFHSLFNCTKNETYFLNLPLHHIGGLMLFLRAFLIGSRLITSEKNNESIQYLSLVPYQLFKIVNNEDKIFNIDSLKNLKALLIGGAKLSDDLLKKAIEWKLPLYETYGMTETASFVSLNHIPISKNILKLDNQNHIMIHSPHLFKGLMIEGQFVLRSDDFFTTNDIGVEDNKGLIHFSHRADRIINSAGEKISLKLIEDTLNTIKEIEQFHVTTFEDIKWGEKIVLFYKSHLSEGEIILKLKESLHPYYIPRHLISFHFIPKYGLKMGRLDFEEAYIKSLFDYQFLKSKNLNSNKTIVLFHGFMESDQDYKFLIDFFIYDFNVLFINLPGHGKTHSKNFNSLDDILNKCESLINLHLTDDELYLLGYSMGGRFALELSPRFKKLISLTLLSSGFGLIDDKEILERNEKDSTLFKNIENELEIQQFFENWYKAPLFGNYTKLDFFKEEMKLKRGTKNLKDQISEWQNSLKFLGTANFPKLDEHLNFLKNVSFKTYYLYGELDLKYKKQKEYLDQLNTNKIKIVEIQNAYHNLHKTHSSELLNALKALF
jgi:O-succinylbenzoic acid--CoA ligase